VQGNFDQVLNNTRLLLEKRKSRRQKTPVVEWQFVVSRKNEHQLGAAEVLAKKLGVDIIRFRPIVLPFESANSRELAEQWYPIGSNKENQHSSDELNLGHVRKKGPCPILYRTLVVNPDGGISPCYYVYQQDRDFAKFDPATSDIRAIWNNDKFRSGRLLSSNLKTDGQHLVACDICDLYERPVSS
jgi:MoaA/NifB/PqqE/SkfB family radical SAM enzyme